MRWNCRGNTFQYLVDWKKLIIEKIYTKIIILAFLKNCHLFNRYFGLLYLQNKCEVYRFIRLEYSR